MTEITQVKNEELNDLESTNVQEGGPKIAKKIKKKCYCSKIRQRKIYKYETLEDSGAENDGWKQEDSFNKESDRRRANKTITDLKCAAWNIELFLLNAK